MSIYLGRRCPKIHLKESVFHKQASIVWHINISIYHLLPPEKAWMHIMLNVHLAQESVGFYRCGLGLAGLGGTRSRICNQLWGVWVALSRLDPHTCVELAGSPLIQNGFVWNDWDDLTLLHRWYPSTGRTGHSLMADAEEQERGRGDMQMLLEVVLVSRLLTTC